MAWYPQLVTLDEGKSLIAGAGAQTHAEGLIRLSGFKVWLPCVLRASI